MQSSKLAQKKVYVADQISCTGSRVYVERYAEFIKSHGASSTKKASEADILLVDTCAFNKEFESRSISLIKESEAAAKDGAKVIVCGCLVGINPQKLQEHYRGEFFSPKMKSIWLIF